MLEPVTENALSLTTSSLGGATCALTGFIIASAEAKIDGTSNPTILGYKVMFHGVVKLKYICIY